MSYDSFIEIIKFWGLGNFLAEPKHLKHDGFFVETISNIYIYISAATITTVLYQLLVRFQSQ